MDAEVHGHGFDLRVLRDLSGEVRLMSCCWSATARWASWSASSPAQYGCEVAGVIDPVSPRHGGGADADCWAGVDVAIDFSTAGVGRRPTCRRSRGAASTSSSARPAGRSTKRRCGRSIARRGRRDRRRAELLDRRRAVRGDRRARGEAVRRAGRVRRVPARGASRGEEGRAVGHGAAAEALDGAGGLPAADRRRRRRAPASFRARTRSASTVRRKRLR